LLKHVGHPLVIHDLGRIQAARVEHELRSRDTGRQQAGKAQKEHEGPQPSRDPPCHTRPSLFRTPTAPSSCSGARRRDETRRDETRLA
jgi:hypothetical protein